MNQQKQEENNGTQCFKIYDGRVIEWRNFLTQSIWTEECVNGYHTNKTYNYDTAGLADTCQISV
jgi:hypothetical protein